jgi:hypothetical protein
MNIFPPKANPANPVNVYLTHFTLKEVASSNVTRERFDHAMDVLKKHGADAWAVQLYGA